jgi:hypothetical protein
MKAVVTLVTIIFYECVRLPLFSANATARSVTSIVSGSVYSFVTRSDRTTDSLTSVSRLLRVGDSAINLSRAYYLSNVIAWFRYQDNHCRNNYG